MWQFISAFVQGRFVQILQILAVAGGVTAILLGFREAGKNMQKVEEMKASIKAGKQRNEIEARNHADSSDIRDRLRKQRNEF